MSDFNRDKAIEALRPFVGEETLQAMGDAELKMALNKFPQLEKVMAKLDTQREEFVQALEPLLSKYEAEKFVLFSMDAISDVMIQIMKIGGMKDEEIPGLMDLLNMFPAMYRAMLLRVVTKIRQEEE
jgi:hypothetical protein